MNLAGKEMPGTLRVLNSRWPADRRAVLLLAAILGLSSADGGTLGALAPQLERAFHIGTTQIDLLVTARSLVGAVSALPLGVLADRSSRTRSDPTGLPKAGASRSRS